MLSIRNINKPISRWTSRLSLSKVFFERKTKSAEHLHQRHQAAHSGLVQLACHANANALLLGWIFISPFFYACVVFTQNRTRVEL